VVSNLVSAHDANSTLTIDSYYDTDNEEINIDPHNPNGGKDSIWNFHVWNDVWMSRPDLPKGYGGWQVIDSTPQERSDGKFAVGSHFQFRIVILRFDHGIMCWHDTGIFQLGPASVEAVRKGQVGFAYDVAFVVAEVNADYVKWRVDSASDWGYSRINSNKYQ
jgi:transglutaminase 1